MFRLTAGAGFISLTFLRNQLDIRSCGLNPPDFSGHDRNRTPKYDGSPCRLFNAQEKRNLILQRKHFIILENNGQLGSR